jgi:hypothetical protein
MSGLKKSRRRRHSQTDKSGFQTSVFQEHSRTMQKLYAADELTDESTGGDVAVIFDYAIK